MGFIASLTSSVSRILYGLYKLILRFVFTECEIARLCLKKYDHGIFAQLQNSIKNSRYLKDVNTAIKKQSTFSQEDIAAVIVKRKNINGSTPQFGARILPSLLSFLDHRKMLNVFFEELQAQKRKAYNTTREEDEHILLNLWSLLKPDERLKSRQSEEWKELGFQGKDPATDFRGGGMLGLLNLHYFALSYPAQARKTLLNSCKTPWYPFAITGINLTAMLVTMAEQGALDVYLVKNEISGRRMWESFHELYCTVFQQFDQFWESEKPADIMSFGPVLKKFQSQLQVV